MLDQEVAPICWAEIATQPTNRIFHAFKWEDGKRVQSRDTLTGAPLFDRRPLRAHLGNNLTGVRDANVASTVKFLRGDGIIADIKVNNGPGHVVDGDDRYQRNVMRKHRHFGGVVVGECPALLVALGMIPPHTVLAADARTAPCSHETLGPRNAPCRHFVAEHNARKAKALENHGKLLESFKSAEAKLVEAQAKAAQDSVATHDRLLEQVVSTQAQIAASQAATPKGASK